MVFKIGSINCMCKASSQTIKKNHYCMTGRATDTELSVAGGVLSLTALRPILSPFSQIFPHISQPMECKNDLVRLFH